MRGAIYRITNLCTSQSYIGSTGQKYPNSRLTNHLYHLRKGNHYNSYLQRAWNKYGEENFEVKIIMTCQLSELIHWEQSFCDVYRELYGVYNLGEFVASPCLGVPRSTQTKEKISKIHLGTKHSKEHIEKVRQVHLGKPLTAEHKEKINKANKGRKRTKECKLAQSLRQRGFDPETDLVIQNLYLSGTTTRQLCEQFDCKFPLNLCRTKKNRNSYAAKKKIPL